MGRYWSASVGQGEKKRAFSCFLFFFFPRELTPSLSLDLEKLHLTFSPPAPSPSVPLPPPPLPDFTAQHAPASIDFAAIHMWPDNWNTTDLAFPPVWIDSHIKESRKLGKPLLLEEFGKQSNGAGDKAPYYDVVFSALETSLANGDNFRGALFWRWAADGGNDATTVQTGDATWNTIMRITKNINSQWQGKKVAGCEAKGSGGTVAAASIGN